MKNEKIIITSLRHPTLKKCEVCDRVKDIYFRVVIKDNENPDFEMGNLNCCKDCGTNLNEILGNSEKVGESTIKTFSFG